MKLSKDAIRSNTIQIPVHVRYIANDTATEKVIQFGEGNFLRAFTNWMFSRLLDENLFDGSVVVVQPIETGRVESLNSQDGLSTLIMRGYKDGVPSEEIEIVKGISRGLNPFIQWDEVLRCAENPDITFVLSNTTEAGIVFDPTDKLNATPPSSFPGKIVAYLYRRYQYFKGDTSKGLIFLPCELNDRNGDLLREKILQLAEYWNLEPAFTQWIKQDNFFLNTLVDRTVPGYPKDEATDLESKLGYQDDLLNVCEMFHLWVIEDPDGLTKCIPFEKAGLLVKRVSDVTPFRSFKVRILNGGHTSSVPAAFLYGLDTVDEMMRHEIMGQYVRKVIFEEIIPSLDGDQGELKDFADEVVLRFENPLIKHYLSSILLNSISKYAARVIDSIEAYCDKYGKAPPILSFSFAALIALYQTGKIHDNTISIPHGGELVVIQDDAQSLSFFAELWDKYNSGKISIESLVHTALSNQILWGRNMATLCELSDRVVESLTEIVDFGWVKAINNIVQE